MAQQESSGNKRLRVVGDGHSGPTYAVWEVTLRCNQACRFCGSRAGKARTDELTRDECLATVTQLAELGVREVSLHGGEAYLRPDWLEIVGAISAHGMVATLVTGGRGLDFALARAAKQAGLGAASVSIDGTESVHDELRGIRGGYREAINAVESLHRAGIPVGVITQANRKNLEELSALTDTILGLPLYGWQVQLMIPMGRAADAEDLWLEPHMMLDLMPRIVAAHRSCAASGLKLWPGDNLGYFGPFEGELRRGSTNSGHCGGCGGGILSIGIESQGSVKPCSSMGKEYVVGNVRSSRLKDLWSNRELMREFRSFGVHGLWGYCASCYYAEFCLGGCPWTSTAIFGRRGNNPYCHHRALEFAAQGKRERLHRIRGPAGEVRDHGAFDILVEDAPLPWLEQRMVRAS